MQASCNAEKRADFIATYHRPCFEKTALCDFSQSGTLVRHIGDGTPWKAWFKEKKWNSLWSKAASALQGERTVFSTSEGTGWVCIFSSRCVPCQHPFTIITYKNNENQTRISSKVSQRLLGPHAETLNERLSSLASTKVQNTVYLPGFPPHTRPMSL